MLIEWLIIDQIQQPISFSCSSDQEDSKTTRLFEKRPRFSRVMKLFTLTYDVIFPFLRLYMIMISHFHRFGNNFQIVITQSNFYHFLKSWWVLKSIFPELQDPHLFFQIHEIFIESGRVFARPLQNIIKTHIFQCKCSNLRNSA